MRIRAADEHDKEKARDVALAAHAGYREMLSPDNWKKMREGVCGIAEVAAEGTLLVAETNGEVVGAVVYLPPDAPKPEIFRRGWAIIRILSVSPGHRGLGTGRRLVERCIRRAKEDGAERIALHSGEMMVTARSIYDRLGFEVVREIEPRFGSRYRVYSRVP
ncbi:GNAT family N-acetyltransferase [Rubrobacter indicoceani]|uniref:GNAT family N-acetyltransferase n=1 Tax=Rubrobacter indicoceani TaxID=2051957 RepID=UPI001F095A80|nr:GNAT family N-acetyltransferase [Rubrobacter indicoceani]